MKEKEASSVLLSPADGFPFRQNWQYDERPLRTEFDMLRLALDQMVLPLDWSYRQRPLPDGWHCNNLPLQD